MINKNNKEQMDSTSEIERSLLMEMEQNIKRSNTNSVEIFRTGATLPPPFEIFINDDHFTQKEDDEIKAEIEKLKSRQEEQRRRTSNISAHYKGKHSPFPGADAVSFDAIDDTKTELARREAEERERREAEEREKREAEEREKREAEEREKREVEEREKREAEERKKREAEECKKREAEECKKREVEEREKREAEERKKREAEEREKREAEERERREVEERKKREAEEREKREAEEREKREAEERERREVEECKKREAEEREEREAEEREKREAEEREKREVEERKKREAEEREKREVEERKKREAEEREKREVEERKKREAEEREKREAEEREKREAEERERREVEECKKREAEEREKREAEEREKREAEEREKREAEERKKREAEECKKREAEECKKREVEEREKREAEEREKREAEERERREVEERKKREAEEREKREAEERKKREAEECKKREVEEREKREAEECKEREAEEQGPDGVCKEKKMSGSCDGCFSVSGDSAVKRGYYGSDECDTLCDMSLTMSCDVANVQNDNGILSGYTEDMSDAITDDDPPHEVFEAHLARELNRLGLSELSFLSRRIECHQYETIRESGRCLYPPGEEREGDISSLSVQLGFFRTKQVVLSSSILRLKQVARREQHSDPQRRLLSTLHCFFESELVQDPSVAFDDEGRSHNAQSESLISENNLLMGSASGAVNMALSRISFGDPIQVWEKARNCFLDVAEADVKTRQRKIWISSPTASSIWVSGFDTKKPVTAAGVFTGGALLRIECTKIGGPLIELHGSDVDPLIVSLAFHSISANAKMKVSETFYFDSAVGIFYPHKGNKKLHGSNQAVTFIPQEFLSSLYLAVRVYRPSNEDYDNYVDLYTRPDRYKVQHVIPMKQETQLLAMSSDVFEELGWFIVRCQQGNISPETILVQKLYRRSVNDAQLYLFENDERSRNALRTVPLELQFTLSDCTSHEVAFPSQFTEPRPEENETTLSILNPDVPGARAETCTFVPCFIPILNAGFFHSYHNVFYFRPNRVKILNTGLLRKVPSSHRTYVMQICVKDQDISLGEEGLPLIYGHRLSGKTFETSVWTSTIHNSLEFDLSDEFKLQLPLYLTDSYHIFITLYASCQKKNLSAAGQQKLYKIGYAALPICRNGVLQVSQEWALTFVAADQAVVIGAGGYLIKFPEAPVSALLNNGLPLLYASTQTRTSVHASNAVIAGILKESTAALKLIVQDNDVLEVSGRLSTCHRTSEDQTHNKIIYSMQHLPLAEILAFYPFLFFLNLALVSSPSNNVGLDCRTAALSALVDMTFKTQQYEASFRVSRRNTVQQKAPTVVQTSVTRVLYYYLTNDLLFNGHRYRVYAGVAETWLNLLAKAKSASSFSLSNATVSDDDTGAGNNIASPIRQNTKKQMADLSWFLFDLILRSLYLWALENSNVPRTKLFHSSFYSLLGKLCTEVLDVLGGFTVGGVLVRRVASFVCNLSSFCDRGQVLVVCQRVASFLEERGDMEGLCVFFKITLEHPDVVSLMLPLSIHAKPVYLSRILVDSFSLLLVHRDRDTRADATESLYTFFRDLVNNPRISAVSLRCLASQLFPLLRFVSFNWKTYVQLCEKVEGRMSIVDERQLIVTMMWITYYTPRDVIHRWLVNEQDERTIAGFMSLLTDTQSLLRYNAGTDKSDLQENKNNVTNELREWDARMSTFATALGARMCSIFLEDIPHLLQSLRRDEVNGVVFPFFVMLESLVHLGNSTVALQFGSCALFEVVCSLFPEIMSRKARMSSGVVLLVLRLMSTCCQHVRTIARRIFLLMNQSFFRWNNSLKQIKYLTVNALVSLAESKRRDLRLVGRFIEFQFEDLLERARKEEDYFSPPSPNYNLRYEGDSSHSEDNFDTTCRYRVDSLFLSVERRISISHHLLDRGSREKATQREVKNDGYNGVVEGDEKRSARFSEEFATMSESALSLFRDVLQLQVSNSMQFKEAKVFALFEVIQNFLRQNALREALKWIHRLYETHRTNEDTAEAGMVLFFMGALCFRLTEVFYFLKGEQSSGARMPFGLLTHVFWHDYVRVLPEVDILFPVDMMYSIISELHVCPDEACFTVEGQVKVLKEAAELLDKEHYYEFSLDIIAIVDKYLRAIGNYKGAVVVHTAMMKWCTAAAQRGKRQNHQYFLLWARMEREENDTPPQRNRKTDEMPFVEYPRGLPNGRAIKRVFKMPPGTQLQEFKDYGKSYVMSLLEDPSIVVVTDELTDTLPAFPEATLKKKRVTAMCVPPNHCLVTVCEVFPSFAKEEPVLSDGLDKTMHISKFENIMHIRTKSENTESRTIDLLNYGMSINKYELDRAFPSITSAIDVKETNIVLLNSYETAKETVNNRIDIITYAPENEVLIKVLKEALTPMGITPPGAYMKEVITVMSSNSDVINAVRLFSTLTRKKLSVCEEHDAPVSHPEDYALVLKALADIECCLIAEVDARFEGVVVVCRKSRIAECKCMNMLAPCNFKDQITGEVTVPSSWRKETTRSNARCQAGPLITREEGVQTAISALQVVNRCDKQVGHEKKPIQATIDGLQYVYAGVEFDEGRLAAFLEESKKDVLSMLYRNAKSVAFSGYEPNWSAKTTDIALVATFLSAYAVEGELHALAVSWNSTGTLLAVAYGRVDTSGWSHTTGVVGIWNLSRHDVDVNTPHYTLETDAFATCVAFHPTEATVLAVGLYNGEVLVHTDVTGGDSVKMSTNGASLSHREPVTSLQWTQSLQEFRDSHRYILCSAAQDGSILFWTQTNKLSQSIAAFSVENKKGVVVGVQSLRFVRYGDSSGGNVPSVDSPMIIGLENGDVGRARPGMVSVLAPKNNNTILPLDINWLSGHKGPVQSVDMSPFFHNLCLTCSSDGNVHLYNVLERSPLLALEPSADTRHFLYAAQFSPFRPSIVAVVSRSSFLHIYDLQESHLKPVTTMEVGVDGAPVLCVAFNHLSPEWLVTGDARGCVRLWRLPSSLIQATDLERAAVHKAHKRSADESDIRAFFGFTL